MHALRAVILFCGAACATLSAAQDPYASTYRAAEDPPTLVRHATVLTGDGERVDDGDVLIVDGKIAKIGRGLRAPSGAREIEAKGRWVTPGIIDVHSHLGVYPSPGVQGLDDGNEATSPSTANVWAEHSIWPDDPGFTAARQGGITSLQILPGSANLFGGRSVTLKNVAAITYQAMKFPGAPQGLKMACGENPKRVYGSTGKFPSTRMGNAAAMRAQWIEATEYIRDWNDYDSKKKAGKDDAKPPKRDLRLDTLAAVLKGDILVHNHCYRAEEMAFVLDMAREFGCRVSTFHHATEAYKVADLLAENNVCAAMWADWWGFKIESYDAIPENIAIVDRVKNGCAIVHSDSAEGIQHLNQEAAKVMARAKAIGWDIRPEHAIRWLTANPAKAIGIDGLTGSLAVGKMADVVVWNRNPFSSYALVDQVLIDGVVVFDRSKPRDQPVSDFLLGQPANDVRL